MKPTDPRWNDTRVIEGSGNVFADLGFDDAQAQVLALRAEAMLRLSEHLRAQGWTQAEAARHLGITQPRVSRLLKGTRSEEHTSELQSLMRISYAVFCLKKKKK